jgi:hypothetical protein
MTTDTSEHVAKAQAFLRRFGMCFSATFHDNQMPPSWLDGGPHGDRYKIILSRRSPRKQMSFDFWNSQADSQAGKAPDAYDVLACAASDINCPDVFEDFCSEYGYSEDSRHAYAMFGRCAKFAERLQAFFDTDEMREALAEIQ